MTEIDSFASLTENGASRRGKKKSSRRLKEIFDIDAYSQTPSLEEVQKILQSARFPHRFPQSFHTQADAFQQREAVISLLSKQESVLFTCDNLSRVLCIYSEETPPQGKRKYLLTFYRDLALQIKDTALVFDGEFPSIYELIIVNRPCWLYFDVEYTRSLNPLLRPISDEKILFLLLHHLKTFLSRFFHISIGSKDIIVLSSSTGKKLSFHIILRHVDSKSSTCFPNNNCMGTFVSLFLEYLRGLFVSFLQNEILHRKGLLLDDVFLDLEEEDNSPPPLSPLLSSSHLPSLIFPSDVEQSSEESGDIVYLFPLKSEIADEDARMFFDSLFPWRGGKDAFPWKERLSLSFVEEILKATSCVVDPCVYSRNRCFRTIFSSKFSSEEVDVLSRAVFRKKRFYCIDSYSSLSLLESSLDTASELQTEKGRRKSEEVGDQDEKEKRKREKTEALWTFGLYEKTRSLEEEVLLSFVSYLPPSFASFFPVDVLQSNEGQRESRPHSYKSYTRNEATHLPIEERSMIESAVLIWYEHYCANYPSGRGEEKEKMLAYKVCLMGDTIHVFSVSLLFNRFCMNIGRPHVSNGVFLVLNTKTGLCYQRCFDAECRHFKSNKFDVPFPLGLHDAASHISPTQEALDEA